MWVKNRQKSGFTIVELLIVIVVIGVLAAITIVAYNGIQERARISSVSSSLNQAARKIAVWQVDNPDRSPSTLSDAGITDSDTTRYQYTPPATGDSYCITATYQSISYYISNSSGGPSQGVCSGFNYLAWNKPSLVDIPLINSAIDTSVYRVSTASMRLGPGESTSLRNNPYTGTAGQIYTVTFSLRTDPTWNGTTNNSKVRFGSATGGLLRACNFNGAKPSWVTISCSYTLTSADTITNITMGNDGTIGNIWIDDFSLTRS